MTISEIITTELLERYQIRHRPTARRYVSLVAKRRPAPTTRKAASSPKIVARPALKIAPVIRPPMLPNSQTTGLNPKIDVTKGHNFRLDNFNLKPEFTDKQIEIVMKSRKNEKRSF